MRNIISSLVLMLLTDQVQGQPKFSTNALVAPNETNDNLPVSPLGSEAFKLYKSSYKDPCTDPDGREILGGLWIMEDETRYQYRDGKLWFNGLLVEKFSSKNLRKIHGYLSKLEHKSSYARDMINALETSGNRFTIKISTCEHSYMVLPIDHDKMGILNNNAYAFQVIETGTLVVAYAPYNRIGSSAEIRWNPKDKIIKVAHELGHAYDANFGLLDDRVMMVDGQAMLRREVRAIFHENCIRQQLNMTMRKSVHDVKTLLVNGQPMTYPLPYVARH